MPAVPECDKTGSFNDSVEPIVEPAVSHHGVNLNSSYVTGIQSSFELDSPAGGGKLSFPPHFSYTGDHHRRCKKRPLHFNQSRRWALFLFSKF